MFYDRFKELCAARDISISKAALEAGINKSSVTYWKNNENAKPTGQIAVRLCEYFNISMSELYGEVQKEKSAKKADLNDEDIKFALSGGDGPITDAQYEEVKKFVQFIKERDKNDQK